MVLHEPIGSGAAAGRSLQSAVCKRVRFDRIAYRRAGAVGFNKADLLRRDAGIFAGVLHKPRLRFGARQRDAVGMSVLIDRRAQDHSLDRVAIRNRSAKVA